MSKQKTVELPALEPEAAVVPRPPLTAGELSAQDAERMAVMFKALSDPVRLRLLSKVASHPGGEACVCDISDVGVSQPTASHHLEEAARGRAADLRAPRHLGLPRRRPSVAATMSAMLDLRAST